MALVLWLSPIKKNLECKEIKTTELKKKVQKLKSKPATSVSQLELKNKAECGREGKRTGKKFELLTS